ncbi:MAG: MFS transporter, partial [Verrucomicrobia bacterium]|nr:MFS transporter [Verrucomicrobiota bacterium]
MNTTIPTAPARRGGFRWTICALLFAATTINYMDRQILGILASTLQTEFGWSEIEYGHIVTAFQAAYAIGMALFGRVIDLIGTKHGYSLAMALWSLAAMAHALARSALGFGVARFALGFGEAGNFPAAVKAVAEWFPRRERALATGLFNAGSNIGAVVAPAVVPWLTLRYGWQAAFVAIGAVGFVWMAFWAVF